MSSHPRPCISSRKEPKQVRSAELVSSILEAAVQVLATEGARRFTTARVAERAGVSIGSLYQYFPNKATILFRLQSDEWLQTSAMLERLLGDRSVPALDRLRRLMHAFILSECEEASVRKALSDSAPLYRDAPEAREIRAGGERTIQNFMEEVLPDADPETRWQAGSLIAMTLRTGGKSFSETPREDAEIRAFADAMADMFCAYLRQLQGTEQSRPKKAKDRERARSF